MKEKKNLVAEKLNLQEQAGQEVAGINRGRDIDWYIVTSEQEDKSRGKQRPIRGMQRLTIEYK